MQNVQGPLIKSQRRAFLADNKTYELCTVVVYYFLYSLKTTYNFESFIGSLVLVIRIVHCVG